MQATSEQFKEWVRKYQAKKNVPPQDGETLMADPDKVIRFTYDEEQDLLSCNLDIDTENIVDEAGVIIDPEWRFVYEDSKGRNGLRVIIVGAEKSLYLTWKESCKVSGLKITNKSRTGKSILAELILDA